MEENEKYLFTNANIVKVFTNAKFFLSLLNMKQKMGSKSKLFIIFMIYLPLFIVIYINESY